jgi:predicted  nucleic acid-binding Zn-ribbon protein
LWNEDGHYFNVLYPLVLALDYEAKPKWCPRWFLRFTHVFGNDKSIVRVRNWFWHNLHKKLTKGMMFYDWKTKWSDYDLRISISAPKHLQDLADDIEHGVYSRGRQQELLAEIKKINPEANPIMGSVKRLEEELENLEKEKALDMLTAQAQELDLGYNVTSDGEIKFKHEK